jgi:hypothetical protein
MWSAKRDPISVKMLLNDGSPGKDAKLSLPPRPSVDQPKSEIVRLMPSSSTKVLVPTGVTMSARMPMRAPL